MFHDVSVVIPSLWNHVHVFWHILPVSLPVVCFLSLATCHHVDVVPLQLGVVCHPSGNLGLVWKLISVDFMQNKPSLPCEKSFCVYAICFSPACFSKFIHVNPAVRVLVHGFKPRRNIEKIEAWTRVEKITDNGQPKNQKKIEFLSCHPKPSFIFIHLIPILASINFLANFLISLWSNWKSFRRSSLSSFSSAFFHSFILSSSSSLWRFNIFKATGNMTW